LGRKTANLVVNWSFRKPGICVDTHVHRISNRWGLVTTKTADKTETACARFLPRRYWIEYNSLVVASGKLFVIQRRHGAALPHGDKCPRIGVVRSR